MHKRRLGRRLCVIAAGREKISVLRIEFLVFTLSEVFRATLVDGGKMVELVVSIRILDINNNVRKKVYESIVAHNRILFPRNKKNNI